MKISREDTRIDAKKKQKNLCNLRNLWFLIFIRLRVTARRHECLSLFSFSLFIIYLLQANLERNRSDFFAVIVRIMHPEVIPASLGWRFKNQGAAGFPM